MIQKMIIPYLFLSIALIALLAEAGNVKSAEKVVEQTVIEVNVDVSETTVLHVWMKALKQKTETIKALKQTVVEHVEPIKALKSKKHGVLQMNSFDILTTNETEYFIFKEFNFKELGLENAGVQTFSWSSLSTEISYFYAYEPETVKQEGIRVLYLNENVRHTPALANSFHFRTPLGWANEPNGFTRTNDGLYHVFYQHIPTQTRFFIWIENDSHMPNEKSPMGFQGWGHAVSKDLINWVHMPVFLFPRIKIDKTQEGNWWVTPGLDAEHWFSGSAVPYGAKGLRVYVSNVRLDGKDKQITIQVEMCSDEGICVNLNQGKDVVNKYPEIIEYKGEQKNLDTANYRDSNVFKGPNGYWYMTLGAGDHNGKGGAIALYRTTDNGPNALDSEWEYQNLLLTDRRPMKTIVPVPAGSPQRYDNIECPGLLPMGDPNDPNTKYVLVYARELEGGGMHRMRDTLIRMGTFNGKKFKTISEKTLDFAFGSYGHQGFFEPQSGEVLMMGWLAWWNEWTIEDPWYTSETLPKILKESPDGKDLLMGPHPNILAQLRGDKITGYPKILTNDLKTVEYELNNGKAYVRVELDHDKEPEDEPSVEVELLHPRYNKLSVLVGPDGLELLKDKNILEGRNETRRLIVEYAKPDIVHIFVDIDSLEIFGELLKDQGTPRWYGSVHLSSNGKKRVTKIEVHNRGLLQKAEVWSMKRAEMRGHFDQTMLGNEDEPVEEEEEVIEGHKTLAGVPIPTVVQKSGQGLDKWYHKQLRKVKRVLTGKGKQPVHHY